MIFLDLPLTVERRRALSAINSGSPPTHVTTSGLGAMTTGLPADVEVLHVDESELSETEQRSVAERLGAPGAMGRFHYRLYPCACGATIARSERATHQGPGHDAETAFWDESRL